MKLDILALMAHPDDAELSIGGILAKHKRLGYKTGIIDYTRGELGTRGTPEIRLSEATESANILGLDVRENMSFRDGFFKDDEEHQLQVIQKLRCFKPNIVLINAPQDRHPDHAKAAQLSLNSCFLSGLKRIETSLQGQAQESWRPRHVYHIIQSRHLTPDFIVDVSEDWDTKMASIGAFKSQFFNPSSTEPGTFISSPEFMEMIVGRSADFGQSIGARYGEGLIKANPIGVKDLFDLH